MPTHECPLCHHVSDLLKGVAHSAREPRNGDMTLCARCGEFSVFSDDGLRLPTAEEAEVIARDPIAAMTKAAWLKQAKPRGGLNA